MAVTALLIVDVQKGFINDWTRHVPGRVEALQARYERVFVTRFFNPEGSFYRTLIGWHRFAPGSDDVALAFSPRADAPILDKDTYTCVGPGFLARLREAAIDTVHLCGIATDNCVLKCAVDLFENGVRPVVLAYACASHGGPDCHAAALLILKRFIGRASVIETEPGAARAP